MKLRLLIISILLAGYLYPQSFDWDWFNKGAVSGSSLLTLTANTDTVWAGNYFPLAVYNDTVRYDSVTAIYATIWRRNSDRTFNRVGITEDLFPSVVDSGTCNINITPIVARIGDYFGWRIVAGGTTYEGISLSSASRIGQDGNITKVKFWYDDGIAFNWCHNRQLYGVGNSSDGYYDDSIAYCDSAIAQLTNKDFRTGTTLDTNYHFSIHFYETPAPVIVVTGDSHMSGFPNDRSWVDHLTRSSYSPTDGLPYRLSAYWQLTNQNVGIGGDKTQTITDRSFVTNQDVTGKNPELVIYDGGSNDGTTTVLDARLYVLRAIDSAIANGFPFYYIESPGMNSRDTLAMARIDSLNTFIKNYIDSNYANDCHYIATQSYLCQNRASSTLFPDNLWDLKPGHNADNTHFTPQAYGMIAGRLVDTLKKFYSFPADTTAVSYSNLTTAIDTVYLGTLDSVETIVKASYVLGIDSLKVGWNRNSNGDTLISLSDHYANGANDTFKAQWNIPNPETGDQVKYRYYIYAHLKNTTTSYLDTFIVKATTVPANDLIIAYDFESDKGLGRNTFGATTVNLANSDDTLTINNASDSTTYIKFTGDANSYAQQTAKTTSSVFTIVMKARHYTGQAGLRLFWSYASLANLWGYTSSANANFMNDAYWTGGGTLDYYTAWGEQADDSVTAWTSNGDLYRGDVLVVNSNQTLTGSSVSAQLTLMSYFDGANNNTLGRLYYVYIYDRILTPAEIALFN